MIIDTPARHIYTGNGNQRVFPIPTKIIGDDYIRIEIDSIYQSDRTKWDIVNNSVIFITAPLNGTTIDIQVATSEEALSVLGSSTSMDIVAESITNVNTVATNIVDINQIVDNLPKILLADDNATTATQQATIATTKASEASASANQALTSRNQAETFKNSASTSATTATTKASEASASATSASTSASQALTSRNQAETFAQQAKASAKLVDSIAELKLISGSNDDKLEVFGYYTKGDGGGGTFYWDATSTETDNGGTIIQATGVATGRWRRVFSGAINVKWFGAKGDGVTDDTVAIQKALNSFGTIADTNYPTKRRSIIFTNGVHRVIKIDIPKYTDVYFNGAILKPFNPLQTLDYLISFNGFSTITNLLIDMEYSVSYRSATYTRGRYNTLNVPIVWRAKLAHIVGDPLWESSTLSYYGDSENIFNGGECNWCINAIEAFGMNTIIHLTAGIKLYSYKWTMDAGDSRKADWESRLEWVIKNHGAMIYVSNSFIGNFSSSVSSIISKFQEIDTIAYPGYNNTYGTVILNNTHIETGALFDCENVAGKNAYTNNTYILNIYGCHGYVSGGNGGYYINLNAQSNQKASILNCNFYGNTISSRAIYADTISVDYNISSFQDATKSAFLIKKIFNKNNALLLSANTSSQSLSSMTNVSFSSYKQADYSNTFLSNWYNSSNGGFIAVTDMYNVEVDISLVLNGNPTIGTEVSVYLNSSIANGITYSTKDIYIRIVGHIPFIPVGSVLTIKARNYDGLSLDGSPVNTLTITANI